MPLVGIETFSPPSPSPSLRRFSASAIASFTSCLARSMKRCRLARLLPFGLGRRSMIFIAPNRSSADLPRFVHPHIPLDEAPDLPRRVAARGHALEEVVVLLLGFAVLLGPEADHRQQVLDLAEHALLD